MYFLKQKVFLKNNVSLCITFRNFPKVPFLLNSHAIPLLGFLTLLTRIKSQDVQVSDYFFVVSKSSLGTNSLFLRAALGMLPIKSTSARTIRKKSCLNDLLIKSENMFKIILKFWFLFEVSSPEIPPQWKFQKFLFFPFSPLFFYPPWFWKCSGPPEFRSVQKSSPSPTKREWGWGVSATPQLLYQNYLPISFTFHFLLPLLV